jgi:hypothetical protein
VKPLPSRRQLHAFVRCSNRKYFSTFRLSFFVVIFAIDMSFRLPSEYFSTTAFAIFCLLNKVAVFMSSHQVSSEIFRNNRQRPLGMISE